MTFTKLLRALLLLTCYLANPANAELAPFAASQSGLLFTVKGSNTVGAQLMPGLAEDYLRAKGLVDIQREQLAVENEYRVSGRHPANGLNSRLFIDIAAHGSSTSFEGLLNGSANLGMSSRPIKAAEAQELSFMGDMLSFDAEKVIAIDGLAIITQADNPVSALTREQVAKVFAGEIRNWRQLGGADRPINLYARDHKSGTWDTFSNLVLGKHYLLHSSARRFESNDELSARVAADRDGIGFVGLAAVNRAKALAIYDPGTEPLLPTRITVATEDYILSRRLFLYLSPTDNAGLLREFIDFAQGATGQARVEQVGYISQDPLRVKPDLADIDHQDYLQAVDQAERLSVNIRFKAGSAELDNKALQDIVRLTRLMQKEEYAERRLLLVGFGDAKQTESRAQVLSKLRATQVKVALYSRGVSSAPVLGFGSIMPVAGADKVRNQRVEVWLL